MSASRLAEDKPITQRVDRVEQELVTAGDVCRALDLGDDRRVRAKGRGAYDSACEPAADDTLDHHRLAGIDLAPCVVDSQPGTDAGPGRAAIYLAFGKDADVPAMSPAALWRSDKDRAIQKTQVGLKGMCNGLAGHDGTLDGDTLFDKWAKAVWVAGQAGILSPNKGVKGAAKGEVITYRTQSWHLHVSIQR
jgi:hypothetical protein